MNKSEYVWYASYGSNMYKDRFRYYIKGGLCNYNSKYYPGCKDKSDPIEDRPIMISHKLYFGNTSGSWDGGGVAFVSPEKDKQEKTLGRMYLIKRNQYEEVWAQEGSSDNWYGKDISLGTADGYEIRTFTTRRILPANDPSEAYIRVIFAGIKDTYPEMTDDEIYEYITGCIRQ